MKTKPFAFVLMPFAAEFDDIYKIGIQEAAEQAGMIAERVDEQKYVFQTILERIQHQIDVADVIIADMTGRNANVFYEVGYAHGRGKICILITKSADDIPFDLKHHRHIVYNNSLTDLRSKLAGELKWVTEEIGRNKSALELKLETYGLVKWNHEEISNGEMIDASISATVALNLVFNLHNRGESAIEITDYISLHSGVNWEWRQGFMPCPVAMSNAMNYRMRTFIFPPVRRLEPNTWTRIAIDGTRTYRGLSLEKMGRLRIPLKGKMMLSVPTAQNIFELPIEIDTVISETLDD